MRIKRPGIPRHLLLAFTCQFSCHVLLAVTCHELSRVIYLPLLVGVRPIKPGSILLNSV